MATEDYSESNGTNPEETIGEIRDASVHFDLERGRSQVLNDVNLNIRRGEILAVVGESGSGKSMFVSSLLDAVEDPGILNGSITYHPKNPDGRGYTEPVNLLDLDEQALKSFRWEVVSMVFQGAMNSFNPTMKIGKHFEETVQAHDADMEDRVKHVRQLFEALHLDADRVMDSYPHELSGGMKQRALIALSLVFEPEVLVMDEPTAALDMLMQRSIIAMLRDLQEVFDLTIIFVTHDLPLVAGLADRIAVMYAFEIVEYGPAADLLTEASHPYTRALLRSLPSIDSDIGEMQPIEGESPDPVNIPSGCSYHPRCSLATEQCVQQDPPLESAEEDQDHAAACFYTEEAKEAIEYTLHAGVMEESE